ncbi:MAG: TonB-dependent receptor [Bacteroidia bacterium]|nr:TonB-dependent receptor [Bacteroidia bacterium]
MAQEADTSLTTAEMKRLSIEQLMTVEIVSVSKWNDKLGTTASAVQIITAEDIRRAGATSVPEALRLADNLHVAQKNSHDWAISARGFNTDLANKLLVLIDGRSVYTPLFSGVFWDRQDYLLADIDHIEIISGPGGTLWGSNAVNGVINIITKKSGDTKGLYAEAGGGTWLRSFAGMRWGGQIGNKGSVRVYAKYFDRLESMYPDEHKASDAWHMTQGGFRYDARMSEQDMITVQGDYYNGREGLSSGGVSDAIGGNVTANWTHTSSDRSDMNLLAYYDRTKLKNPVPSLETNGMELAPAGTLKDDLHTYNMDFQHRIRIREHNRFIWGLGYRYMHDVVSNAPALAFEPEALDRNPV